MAISRFPNITGRAAAAFLFSVALFGLSACNSRQPSDEELRRRTAEATQKAKDQAQKAAADARAAAANAEQKVNDIAAGVKQGLNANGKPASININTASVNQLATLPGVTVSRAQRVVHGRPYDTTRDLVSKGVLTKEQFDRISPQITAE